MSETLIGAILTSAVVSSVIGGLFLFFSERSKRISEEKRVKMEIASRLTELHDNKVKELINRSSGKVLWRNHANTFYKYYVYLEEIWKTGKYKGKDFDSPIPD